MSDNNAQGSSSTSSTSSSASSPGAGVNVQQLKSQLVNKFQAYRQLVLLLNSVLRWEQDIYPIFVAAFVSFSFLIIHLLNSSILTTFSYLGIALALLDLAIPTISKNLLGGGSSSNQKSNEKEQQELDKICLEIAKVYASFRGLCDTLCALKTKQPKIYYPAVLGSLLVSAYIGNKFNNLFLTYLITLLVALYPGLEKRGVPQKVYEAVLAKLGRGRPAASTGGNRRK